MFGGQQRMMALLTLPADYRRQAAYRRLALTILGLDVPSLLLTLPVKRETSRSPAVTASRYMSCDRPRPANIAATPLA
jgi:hypothetical protein